MSKSVRTKILIFFLVAFIALTPMAVLYPRVTALTDYAYEDEKGNLEDPVYDEYSGMGYGNAFDMFGELTTPETTEQLNTTTTQSTTKEYQVAVKKNERTPTEPGSKEVISTTKSKFEDGTLDYNSVGKNQNIKGEKLRTLPKPSEESKNSQLSKGYLIAIKNPDPNYKYNGKAVDMTEKDLDIAERLVMGEAGTMGFYGCCLVAQAIRDTYYYGNFKSINAVRIGYGYDGSIKHKPNAAARKAVKYILKQGNSAIQHRILYFYNPRLCVSKWHESRDYLVTYKDVRFFDK
ncbi:MAG: hypothetical protein ACI4HZ_10595 [Ruminococcus sp.]